MPARAFPIITTFAALLLAFSACRPDPGTDAFTRKYYQGRWNLELLKQVFSQPGQPDSLSSLNEGYMVLDLDETFDENPIFIEAGLASKWQMLAPLINAGLAPLGSTGSERRAYWRQDEEEQKFTVWDSESGPGIASTSCHLGRNKERITLTYREFGGPQGEVTLYEQLEFVKE